MTASPSDPSDPAPAGPSKGATASKATPRKPARASAASARRRSRELALMGLYQWLIAGGDGSGIEADIREQPGFERCDRVHFDALLHGGIREAATLDAAIGRHVDRPTRQLSPVEHAVLMIGAYELAHCIDVPYRVVINEAVELAKSFGGTDGHKYVNGVLDKTAADLRPAEVQARRASRGGTT